MMIRRFGALVTVFAAIVLAGCATVTSPLSSQSTGSATPTATPSVDPLKPPVVAFDLTCDEFLPLAALRSLLVDDLAPMVPMGGLSAQRESALLQDSALVCWWYSESTRAQVRAVALDSAVSGFTDAAEQFRAWPYADSRYAELPLFDGGFGHCSDGHVRLDYSCDWSILAGTTWISLHMDLVPAGDVVIPEPRTAPDGSMNPLAPRAEGGPVALLIAESVGRVEAVSTRPRPQVPPDIPECDVLLSAEALTARTGAQSVTVFGQPWTAPVMSYGGADRGMFPFSYERVGHRECRVEFVFADSEPSGVVLHIQPEGAWQIRYEGPSPDPLPVPALGTTASGCVDDVETSVCRLAYASEAGVISIMAEGLSVASLDLLEAVLESSRVNLPGW